jgi:hypothetical protein
MPDEAFLFWFCTELLTHRLKNPCVKSLASFKKTFSGNLVLRKPFSVTMPARTSWAYVEWNKHSCTGPRCMSFERPIRKATQDAFETAPVLLRYLRTAREHGVRADIPNTRRPNLSRGDRWPVTNVLMYYMAQGGSYIPVADGASLSVSSFSTWFSCMCLHLPDFQCGSLTALPLRLIAINK